MSIQRIERKSFLGPIRINTSSSGASSVGEQVVRFADSQRERHYKVAVAAAENTSRADDGVRTENQNRLGVPDASNPSAPE